MVYSVGSQNGNLHHLPVVTSRAAYFIYSVNLPGNLHNQEMEHFSQPGR